MNQLTIVFSIMMLFLASSVNGQYTNGEDKWTIVYFSDCTEEYQCKRDTVHLSELSQAIDSSQLHKMYYINANHFRMYFNAFVGTRYYEFAVNYKNGNHQFSSTICNNLDSGDCCWRGGFWFSNDLEQIFLDKIFSIEKIPDFLVLTNDSIPFEIIWDNISVEFPKSTCKFSYKGAKYNIELLLNNGLSVESGEIQSDDVIIPLSEEELKKFEVLVNYLKDHHYYYSWAPGESVSYDEIDEAVLGLGYDAYSKTQIRIKFLESGLIDWIEFEKKEKKKRIMGKDLTPHLVDFIGNQRL